MTAKKFSFDEDAFGTPAAARGSMLNIAGASEDDDDLPLLTDDSEGDDKMSLGELRRLVRTLIRTGGR
jgi:hypothetical protein